MSGLNWLEVCGVLFLIAVGIGFLWLLCQAVFLALLLRKM